MSKDYAVIGKYIITKSIILVGSYKCYYVNYVAPCYLAL